MKDGASIRFVNLHYSPDVAATAQRLTDLAEYLARDGFSVSVLCARGGYEGESRAYARREVRRGVLVRRIRSTHLGRDHHWGRLLDYATFMLSAFIHLLVTPRRTLVVALTTPPLTPSLAALVRLIRRHRIVVWSMDLHPDAEKALGMLPVRHPVTRILDRINDFGYRSAHVVVDLGAHMRARVVSKGVRPERTATIPVWGNDLHALPLGGNPLRTEWGLSGRTVVLYAGNAGMAHRFDEIVNVMARFEGDESVAFVFIGGGPRKKEILRAVEALGVTNFQYRGYVPQEQLAMVPGRVQER
jgi:colanic acid biosynthesis glycosyl transferase WcaI